MSKLILPEDIDVKTAIEILQSFIDALNYSVLKESEIKSNGNVMVKGDSIHELLSSCIKQQKQLRINRAYNVVKGSEDRITEAIKQCNEEASCQHEYYIKKENITKYSPVFQCKKEHNEMIRCDNTCPDWLSVIKEH